MTTTRFPNVTDLTVDDLIQITDVNLFRSTNTNKAPDEDIKQSYFIHATDGKTLFQDSAKYLPLANYLMDKMFNIKQDTLNFQLKGITFRAQRDSYIHGTWYVIRRLGLEEDPPRFSKLKTPAYWPELLTLEASHKTGGIIVFSGSNGQGKTTTMHATIMENAHKFPGATAITIESPHEYVLPMHIEGGGTIIQTDPADSWTESLRRNARRYHAANPYNMLALGEIREQEAAVAAINSASNGLLVFLTVHANSEQDAIERLITSVQSGNASVMTEETARKALARSLRVICHQHLSDTSQQPTKENPFPKPINGSIAYSANGNSALAKAILSGTPEDIAHAIDRQRDILEQAHKRTANIPSVLKDLKEG